MNDQQKKNTISKFAGAMSQIDGPKRYEIINRQLAYFAKADKELAMEDAKGLNFNFSV